MMLVPEVNDDCETWRKECSEEVMKVATEAENMEWIKSVRRKIHEFPELTFEEVETSQLIQNKLTKLEIEFQFPLAITGIHATIGTGAPPYVALRADMDALPIHSLGWSYRPFEQTVVHFVKSYK